MDLVDITDWQSESNRTIKISQVFLDAPYLVEVKAFVPHEGDMLEEKWTDNNVVKTHRIPPYALADMEKTAQSLRQFLDRSITEYVGAIVAELDDLFKCTYHMAMVKSSEAKVSHDYTLIRLLAEIQPY